MKSEIFAKHRQLVEEIKNTFVKKCDQITLEAKQKMATTCNAETKQQIFIDQQSSLKDTLGELSIALTRANEKLIKDLEDENRQKDLKKLNQLDQLINNL